MSERRTFIAFGAALGVAVLAGFLVVLLAGGGFGGGSDGGARTAGAQPTSEASPSPTEVPSATRTPEPPATPSVSPTTPADDGIPLADRTSTPASTAAPTAAGTAEPPPPSPTPTPTSTPSPTATPPPTPAPTSVAGPPPTASPPPGRPTGEPFTGIWRITDTVTSGSGIGSVFTFDVVLTQAGSVLSGGSTAIQVIGTVEGATAQAQFSQPAEGYTGTFTWSLASPDRGTGTFSTAGLNSGASELIRLD